ncbi:MAG: ATP-binding protein [Saccharofermentanales bacterium]
MDFVESYIEHIGYGKTPMEYLTEAKPYIVNGKISTAAILLFGKNPQIFYPRAQVRFIKYQGTQEKTGVHMNVIKDVIFDGTILQMLKKAIDFVGTQIREYTKLEKGGLFNTIPEYPEFVWNEIIVNAVCHRDYSIKGTDIQIKMFDDRLVVESPGTLPGLVRINNMRNTHFSRNPKIAEFLRSYKYVKEFGEGIDRMFLELESVGLKDPKYELVAFMTKVTIENNVSSIKNDSEAINEAINEAISEAINEAINEAISEAINEAINETEKIVLNIINKNVYITIHQIALEAKFSKARIDRTIKELKEKKY